MNGTPQDLLRPVGSFPVVVLPDPARIFADRSRRFAALAEGHSLSDWLSFLGRLTQAQHELLQTYPRERLRDEAAPAFARARDLSPISVSSWQRDPSWQEALATLARDLAPHAPTPARQTLERLRTMDGAALEALADRVLRVELDGRDIAAFPFVAAALQVHWTALAASLDRTKIGRLGAPGACPCCDYLPVAAIVRTDGEVPRLRYLHCALCNTEWHLERVTCAACHDSTRIAYYHIEGSDGSVRAETCDACRSYLKIVYRKESPQADPVADDLATLPLDLLVQDAGYDRTGLNLLFAPGCDTGVLGSD